MGQAEYEREAIDWSYITFVDNQDVLDLIEKKPLGILDLLDECCRFPRVRPPGWVALYRQICFKTLSLRTCEVTGLHGGKPCWPLAFTTYEAPRAPTC